MAAPVSEGRMLRKDISRSGKFAELTPAAGVLFAMLVPHFNAHGKMQAEPYTIKGTICPKIPYIVTELPYQSDEIERIKDKYGTTPRLVSELLDEITKKTSVKWFLAPDGLHYLHSVNNHEHQKFTKKKGEDRLPSWPGIPVPNLSETTSTPELLRDQSRTSPRIVPPEVEVEVEVEGEGEVEVEGGGEGEGVRAPATVPAPPLGATGRDLPEGVFTIGDCLPGSRTRGRKNEPPEPIDYTNPEHFAMVKYLDEAGVKTETFETVTALRTAYEIRKRLDKTAEDKKQAAAHLET